MKSWINWRTGFRGIQVENRVESGTETARSQPSLSAAVRHARWAVCMPADNKIKAVRMHSHLRGLVSESKLMAQYRGRPESCGDSVPRRLAPTLPPSR